MSTTFNNNNLSSVANLQETNSESINDVRNTELSTREYSINAERNITRVKRGLSSQDLNRIFRSIISVLFCLILILFVFFIIFKATNVPYRVMISNVTGNSATISWVTNRKDIGVVIYGDQKVGFTDTWGDNIEYDDRDWAIAEAEYANNLVNQGSESMSIEDYDPEIKITQLGAYYVHHVQIKNLNPQTQYYFRVGNGLWSWDVNPERQKSIDESFATANLFTFTTFDSPEQLPSPNPAYGRIYSMYRNDSGFLQENDSTDSIVYTKMVKADGSASSEILSSVTNDMGGWTIDKSNFRDNQGLLTESYEDGVDKLSVFTQFENYSRVNRNEFILGVGDAPTEHILGNTWEDIGDEEFTVKTESKSGFKDFFLGNVFSKDGVELETEEGLPETRATGNTNSETGNSATATTDTPAQCNVNSGCEVVSPECFGVNGLRQNYNNNGCTYGYTNENGCCVANRAKDECESKITGAIGCDRPNCYCKILETGDWEPIDKDCRPLSCQNNRPFEAIGEDGHIEFCKFGVNDMNNKCNDKPVMAAVSGGDEDDETAYSIDDLYDDSGTLIAGEVDDNGNVCICEPVDLNENGQLDDREYISTAGSLGMKDTKSVQCSSSPDTSDTKCHWTRPDEKIVRQPGDLCTKEEEGIIYAYKTGREVRCEKDSNENYVYNVLEDFRAGIYCNVDDYIPEEFICEVTSSYNYLVLNKQIGDDCSPEDILASAFFCSPNGLVSSHFSNDFFLNSDDVTDNNDVPSMICCENVSTGQYQVVDNLNICIAPYTQVSMETCVKKLSLNVQYAIDNSGGMFKFISYSSQTKIPDGYNKVNLSSSLPINDYCCVRGVSPGSNINYEVMYNDPSNYQSNDGIQPVCLSWSTCFFDLNNKPTVIILDEDGNEVDNSYNSTNLLINRIQAQENVNIETPVVEEDYQPALYLPESGIYTLDLGETQMDLFMRSDANYYFYEEVNGVDGFQIPSDPYNPKEGEDRIYNLAQMEVKLEKKASTYEIELKKGINIISFPFMPTKDGTNAMKASEFLEYINNQAVLDGYERGAGSITYFDGGKWDGGYKIGSTDNRTNSGLDFDLLFGRGYLVLADKDMKVEIPGFEVKSEVPIAFGPGWNLIGVHGYTDAYTASSFIDSITEIDGLTADNVTYWPTSKGAYQGLQKTGDAEYGFDFPIFNNVGYFVRISEFAPANDNTRTLIWNPGTNLHGKPGSNM